uniref:(California timema) hypothetical protein n=1 Tax=Timema californicum TaxID=61474 RepID=A0A7R9J3V9_TIMCA|nr:unnamed protein product [Timema californicum]
MKVYSKDAIFNMSEDKDVQGLPEEQVEVQKATGFTYETTPQETPLITNVQALDYFEVRQGHYYKITFS